MNARSNICIDLRGPVFLLILAATAIPVELQSPRTLNFIFDPVDALENIAGYIPVGIVLGGLPVVRAILIAAALSLVAELSQCVMMYRDASIMDVIANVIGGSLGVAAAAHWRMRSQILLRSWMSIVAVLLTVGLVAVEVATANPGLNARSAKSQGVNARGSTSPGVLEAHWSFDETDGDATQDSSPHALRGVVKGGTLNVPGIRGGAVALDGNDDYIDFGEAPEFRMIGSLTISAWINIHTNPVDDAAIVSNLSDLNGYTDGFQLDTTIDSGPRTIGFKMADACGRYFARYGTTPLQLDTWYFVTGVYDAQARTMDVYLNGRLDNGVLAGTVPGARRSSREPLSMGRRSSPTGFQFAGLVDDVRIYSRALTHDEVVADMDSMAPPAGLSDGNARPGRHDDSRIQVARDPFCWVLAGPRHPRFEDTKLPARVAVLGLLVCIATFGFGRFLGPLLGVTLGAAGGLLLFRVAAPDLPLFNAWTLPLTGAAVAASIFSSMRVQK